MPDYHGVAYRIDWKGHWTWTVLAHPGDSTGLCTGSVECSAPPEDWRAVAEAAVEAAIRVALARGLIRPDLSAIGDSSKTA